MKDQRRPVKVKQLRLVKHRQLNVVVSAQGPASRARGVADLSRRDKPEATLRTKLCWQTACEKQSKRSIATLNLKSTQINARAQEHTHKREHTSLEPRHELLFLVGLELNLPKLANKLRIASEVDVS
jgi:hypothetical protein